MRGHTFPRKFCQRRKETRQWQNLFYYFSIYFLLYSLVYFSSSHFFYLTLPPSGLPTTVWHTIVFIHFLHFLLLVKTPTRGPLCCEPPHLKTPAEERKRN